MMGDWFERLTGFVEDGYEPTQRRLSVEGDELVSSVNGKRYGVGSLTVPTLASLREQVSVSRGGQRTSVNALVGDARSLHTDPRFAGALFQVASQFNLLEMISENVTPEHGVTRYASDPPRAGVRNGRRRGDDLPKLLRPVRRRCGPDRASPGGRVGGCRCGVVGAHRPAGRRAVGDAERLRALQS